MDKNMIICVGRQLGSGGKEIAEKLSVVLDIPLYDKEILAIAARNTGFKKEMFENADEKVSQNVLGWFLGSSPLVSDSLIIQDSLISNDALFKMQCETINQIASKGSAIFVGRCADYILRDHPNRVSFFISADQKNRIERLCHFRGITMEEAVKTIKKSDKQRSTYYKYYTDKTWGAAWSYDFCLNSSVFGIDGTVDSILELLNRKK